MEMSPPASTILVGDVFERLAEMADESVHCVVTSPPYWALRDYGTGSWVGGDPACEHELEQPWIGKPGSLEGTAATQTRANEVKAKTRRGGACACGAVQVDQQLGLESSPEEYVDRMVAVFREVRRVLRSDGTLWLNIGDSYASKTRGSDNGWETSRLSNPGTVQKAQAASMRRTGERHRGKTSGLKEKDLVGIPWELAFALRDDGWWLRRDNIWSKRNPMPESTSDRTTSAHEYMFMLTKSARYFYDADAVREEAEWARWGDQTTPKHNGEPMKVGWMQSKSRAEIAAIAQTKQAASARADGGSSTRRLEGLNDRWDTSKANGTAPNGRNKRSVWEIAEGHEEAAEWLADLFLETMRAGDERLSDTVWSIATQPYAQAHFATFPTKLVEPCVMAGTSERGVCPACLAPWERVSDVAYVNPGNRATNGARSLARRHIEGGSPGFVQRLERTAREVGWRPTCTCYDDLYRACSPRPRASKRWQNITWWERARARPGDPSWTTVPATVYDPFSGAATTLLVAKRLGRASIGTELNPDYAELGRRRLERWWAKPPRAAKPVDAAQLDLFAPIEGGTYG